MLGLVDGNNFYASCERVFDPRLRGRPVIVLSNNDGCAIARSNEAKALGITMGQPLHEIPKDVRKQCIVRSANFALYGDMSGRVATILRDLFPRVEVYSIDESFVSFDGIPNIEDAALEARRRILQWTGIPCCVGIGSTKTLAKAGNKLAKSSASGVVLATRDKLARLDVGDVWGVGRKFCRRLGEEGILSALDLANAPVDHIRSRYGVVLGRTVTELNERPCDDLQEVEPQRQQLIVSRSFGREVQRKEDIAEALATFATRACEKLRQRALKANGVWVFMHTNPFKPNAPQYSPSCAVRLPTPTSDTRQVLEVVQSVLKSMYREGYAYKKGGIGLLDLVDSDVVQGDLFAPQDHVRSNRTMDVMDTINRKFGRGTMGLGATGWRAKPQWGMRQENLSPAYTTKWSGLMQVSG